MAVGIPIQSFAAPKIRLRRLTLDDLRIALRQGWSDYLECRGEIIFLGMIYPVFGLIACLAFSRQNLLPLIFPLASGFCLMGPPLACGFYELARRRERGEDTQWLHAFSLFKGSRLSSIGALTLAVTGLYAAWLAVAWGIYRATLGAAPDAASTNFLSRLLTTAAGWEMILIGNATGLLFAVAVFAISVISFPMLVDEEVSPMTAAEISLRAVALNPDVLSIWGLVIAALLLLGSLPLFVGLAAVFPTLGYASWHLYTRMVRLG